MTYTTNYNSNGPRPMDMHSVSPNTVRCTRQVISRINGLVGGILLGVGMIVVAIGFMVSHDAAVLALLITGASLAFSGIIELTIAAFFRRSAGRQQARLARLKAEGLGFPGVVVSVKRHHGVRLGHSFSAYVECTYVNHEGKTCLVKSPTFLHAGDGAYGRRGGLMAGTPSIDNYSAHVYVNSYDPTDYAVEVFTQPVEVQGVYDFR